MALQDNVRAFLQERRFGVLATINEDGSAQQTVMCTTLMATTS